MVKEFGQAHTIQTSTYVNNAMPQAERAKITKHEAHYAAIGFGVAPYSVNWILLWRSNDPVPHLMSRILSPGPIFIAEIKSRQNNRLVEASVCL